MSESATPLPVVVGDGVAFVDGSGASTDDLIATFERLPAVLDSDAIVSVHLPDGPPHDEFVAWCRGSTAFELIASVRGDAGTTAAIRVVRQARRGIRTL